MKVRCINNKRFEEELTKGKIYEVCKEVYKDGLRYYCMTDDMGDEDSKYFQSRFEVVEETEQKQGKTIKVRCVNNKRLEIELTVGKIYEVRNYGTYYLMTDNLGNEIIPSQSRFEVVTDTTKTGEENVMEKKREFNFVLPSVCAFSRQEWFNDLSKENPLIVFRVNGYTDFIIHESVVKKINYLKLRMPELTNTDHDISVLAEFVKSVKAKNWNDEKACVKIVIPKI